jgi:hypothetical protein
MRGVTAVPLNNKIKDIPGSAGFPTNCVFVWNLLQTGGVASESQANIDRRERLRKLALEKSLGYI